MVRLTRLRIDRFRNVKPGTDLRFGPTFNVLLGKNATGKSTLLDLVAAVTNDDLSAYAKEDAGFDLTWWIEKGTQELELRAVRSPAKAGALSEHVRVEKEFDDVSLVVHFETLGSLAKIPALLGFASAELRPRVLTRSHVGEKVTTGFQGLDFLFRRADGSQISHELLSFGQKRLFSFLWYLAVRDELPVVADELLNGLHHEWIEVCFDRLRDRQSFLATQHPLLLDHIPIESAEGVRTTFIRCSTEPGPDGREQMVWRNFDEDEAERFFIAYQTGIQQVSEVLRSEGLW
jgi:hypothetical protein